LFGNLFLQQRERNPGEKVDPIAIVTRAKNGATVDGLKRNPA